MSVHVMDYLTNNDEHANLIVKQSINSLSSVEVWNKAIGFSIETVREVLREECSSLTQDAANDLQQRLRQQMLE